jgi:8-oxo-dGTP pyrophosphatase MutT (NUDIX family)
MQKVHKEAPDALSGDEFFERARSRLNLEVPHGLNDPDIIPKRGDHESDPVMEKIATIRPIRPAAVLVPIIAREQPMVLLTKRAAHLRDHSGQVSFPGGKIDSADDSPAAAALREAEEEIGLSRGAAKPIGYLDVYMTTLGFRIVPVIAQLETNVQLALNKAEVDEAFEVPLAFVMDQANHQRHSREWQGMTRHYYAIPYGERYIWGVTAGILLNLYDRLYK